MVPLISVSMRNNMIFYICIYGVLLFSKLYLIFGCRSGQKCNEMVERPNIWGKNSFELNENVLFPLFEVDDEPEKEENVGTENNSVDASTSEDNSFNFDTLPLNDFTRNISIFKKNIQEECAHKLVFIMLIDKSSPNNKFDHLTSAIWSTQSDWIREIIKLLPLRGNEVSVVSGKLLEEPFNAEYILYKSKEITRQHNVKLQNTGKVITIFSSTFDENRQKSLILTLNQDHNIKVHVVNYVNEFNMGLYGKDISIYFQNQLYLYQNRMLACMEAVRACSRMGLNNLKTIGQLYFTKKLDF